MADQWFPRAEAALGLSAPTGSTTGPIYRVISNQAVIATDPRPSCGYAKSDIPSLWEKGVGVPLPRPFILHKCVEVLQGLDLQVRL
jgi:hypothetical protein